ncbi:hypothetical protein JEQ12_019518 [Ovis aries]|uniref:Uncharacterized protein n=1 Tax=Ovis aries TaxID=9940 RepID=A0A836A7J0_SHEEP|nr:hypothetical protein JEQ12_019518 [Ovis aries]
MKTCYQRRMSSEDNRCLCRLSGQQIQDKNSQKTRQGLVGTEEGEGPTEWPQITYQNTRQNFNKEKFLSRHSSVGFDSPSAKGEKKHVDPNHVL